MSVGAFPFALRELRQTYANRGVLAALAGLGVILGISGPFNTLEIMPLLPRIAYWAVVVFATFGIGLFISSLCEQLMKRLPYWVRFPLTSIAIGLAVLVVLLMFNTAVFGAFAISLTFLFETALAVILIAAVVEAGTSFAQSHSTTETITDHAPPQILARLPHDKRGRLIAMSATDHYVNIVTTQGSALVLMRLADAIAETGDTGLQVHRSHWVAQDQVVKATRKGDRAVLTMSDKSEIPVSRSYMPAARAAGLIKD